MAIHGTGATQPSAMTRRTRQTVPHLEADIHALARELLHSPATAHLNLHENEITNQGTERLEGLLGQCENLSHLKFSRNYIGVGLSSWQFR